MSMFQDRKAEPKKAEPKKVKKVQEEKKNDKRDLFKEGEADLKWYIDDLRNELATVRKELDYLKKEKAAPCRHQVVDKKHPLEVKKEAKPVDPNEVRIEVVEELKS